MEPRTSLLDPRALSLKLRSPSLEPRTSDLSVILLELRLTLERGIYDLGLGWAECIPGGSATGLVLMGLRASFERFGPGVVFMGLGDFF